MGTQHKTPRPVQLKQALRLLGSEHIHSAGEAGESSGLFSALSCQYKGKAAREIAFTAARTHHACWSRWHLQRGQLASWVKLGMEFDNRFLR